MTKCHALVIFKKNGTEETIEFLFPVSLLPRLPSFSRTICMVRKGQFVVALEKDGDLVSKYGHYELITQQGTRTPLSRGRFNDFLDRMEQAGRIVPAQLLSSREWEES